MDNGSRALVATTRPSASVQATRESAMTRFTRGLTHIQSSRRPPTALPARAVQPATPGTSAVPLLSPACPHHLTSQVRPVCLYPIPERPFLRLATSHTAYCPLWPPAMAGLPPPATLQPPLPTAPAPTRPQPTPHSTPLQRPTHLHAQATPPDTCSPYAPPPPSLRHPPPCPGRGCAAPSPARGPTAAAPPAGERGSC